MFRFQALAALVSLCALHVQTKENVAGLVNNAHHFHMKLTHPGALHRRESLYVTTDGYITTDITKAAGFALYNGVLYSGDSLISADTTDQSIPFTAVSPVREVTTTWSIEQDQPVWQNASWVNGQASFCETRDNRVHLVLQTPPDHCIHIVANSILRPEPVSVSSSSLSSATPTSTAVTSSSTEGTSTTFSSIDSSTTASSTTASSTISSSIIASSTSPSSTLVSSTSPSSTLVSSTASDTITSTPVTSTSSSSPVTTSASTSTATGGINVIINPAPIVTSTSSILPATTTAPSGGINVIVNPVPTLMTDSSQATTTALGP